MTEAEAIRFLSNSKSVVKLGTIDATGDPNVHPVWYYFNPKRLELYAFVGANTRKDRNIKERGRVYFLVDQDRWPYKGVRGKGKATELVIGTATIALAEKILARYLKKDHPMFAHFVESVKKGSYTIVRISPRYLSTWDYGKMAPQQLLAGLD